jgi:hypothetical protein
LKAVLESVEERETRSPRLGFESRREKEEE